MNAGIVAGLWHYPVKGLSGQALDEVALSAGTGFPDDRVFAFARARGAYDAADPKPLQKSEFHMLARDAVLAKLNSHYAQGVLTLDAGKDRAAFDLATPEGRAGAEHFVAAHLRLGEEDRPRLAVGGPHRFTDVSVVSPAMMNAVSLISLSTVRALGQRVGAELDPMRFRGNITFDGFGPNAELEWEGQMLGVGTARLRGIYRTERCAATTVNPATAVRDVMVPARLMDIYGHADLGIYAEVVEPGTVRPGDTLELLAD